MIPLVIVVIAIVVWMIYEYVNAPTYDEQRKVFYKKKKKK